MAAARIRPLPLRGCVLSSDIRIWPDPFPRMKRCRTLPLARPDRYARPGWIDTHEAKPGRIIFGSLKDWKRVATRYDRLPTVFLSAIALAATVLFWLCAPNRAYMGMQVESGLRRRMYSASGVP